ncbi:MAG: hypothetical protein LUD50_05375 [Clostridia bacterium]|nr:hypothetical protein [Clostridia bacterium]
MKFKHACHVLVDNFSLIFKQLLFRIVLWVIFAVIYYFCIYPAVVKILNSEALSEIIQYIKDIFNAFISGDLSGMPDIVEAIKTSYADFIEILSGSVGSLIETAVLVAVVRLVSKWITTLCNYGAAQCISDKMSMRTDDHFFATTIRCFRKSSIYSLLYVLMSFVYEILVTAIMIALLYALVVNSVLPLLLAIFIFVAVLVFAIAVQLTFASDWIPALTRGTMTQREAIKYTFKRKNKKTANMLANYVILVLLIFSINVLAAISTIGVGLLITVPASYVMLLCFQMVAYHDRERITYSIGPDSMVEYKSEHIPTKEEFFRGAEDPSDDHTR